MQTTPQTPIAALSIVKLQTEKEVYQTVLRSCRGLLTVALMEQFATKIHECEYFLNKYKQS